MNNSNEIPEPLETIKRPKHPGILPHAQTSKSRALLHRGHQAHRSRGSGHPMIAPTEIPDATDLGRAILFIERFGDSLRYVPDWDRWIVFENRRWNIAGGRAAAHRLAREICAESHAQALTLRDNSQRQAAIRNAAAWADVRIVKDMLLSAQNDQRVIVRPFELDADPWLVGARNGFVDLRTGERFEHSCEHLVTKFVGADFAPNATCPRWEKFMPSEILCRRPRATASADSRPSTFSCFFMGTVRMARAHF